MHGQKTKEINIVVGLINVKIQFFYFTIDYGHRALFDTYGLQL